MKKYLFPQLFFTFFLLVSTTYSQEWFYGIGLVHGRGIFEQPSADGIQITLGTNNSGKVLAAMISVSRLRTVLPSELDNIGGYHINYRYVLQNIKEGKLLGDIFKLTTIEISPLIVLLHNSNKIDLFHFGAGIGLYFPSTSFGWKTNCQIDENEIEYYSESIEKPLIGFNLSMELGIPISKSSRIAAGAKYIFLRPEIVYDVVKSGPVSYIDFYSSPKAILDYLIFSATYCVYF